MLSVFLSYIFTFCAGFIPPCKMEFIPRINQIRLSGSQNVGRKPVYSGEDNPDIVSPPPRPVFTQVFLPEKLKSGRYYQALGYPWPNIGLNMAMARSRQPATDLCLSKAVRGRVIGQIGQIWPKYGAVRWSIHFPATDTYPRKKPLFNQALPLLWGRENKPHHTLCEKRKK